MILQTHGLIKDYDGLRAIDSADLVVAPNQLHALIGPNGAGKTTLVGMISGRIPSSAGQVIFNGQDVTNWPAHRRIRAGMGYTFQITSVFGALSVQANLALATGPLSNGKATERRVKDLLTESGLDIYATIRAQDLSYGHQRLLEIAMGRMQDPKLLILDEPTQGLSDKEIADFKKRIKQMAQSCTILLIEHNMDVVMDCADQITVLATGQVLAQGTPDQIQADKAVQDAYLGVPV